MSPKLCAWLEDQVAQLHIHTSLEQRRIFLDDLRDRTLQFGPMEGKLIRKRCEKHFRVTASGVAPFEEEASAQPSRIL